MPAITATDAQGSSMLHSIIIPNRDYTPWLRHCLRSIERSAKICSRGPKDYEVIVVDEPSQAEAERLRKITAERAKGRCNHCGALGTYEQPVPLDQPPTPHCGRIVMCRERQEVFNKPRLLNIGLEEARGELLTFLDADAIVGPRFMEAVDALERLGELALTKLCYRVRYLPQEALGELDRTVPQDSILDCWFQRYGTYQMASEGYGEAHNLLNEKDLQRTDVSGMPIFGNSQFSITRRAMGGLGFDEGFIGRGFEDLWINRQIWRRHGDDYRAAMVTDAQHAMFHIRNPPKENWGPGEQNKANQRRYRAT